jgi:hypothetical protein
LYFAVRSLRKVSWLEIIKRGYQEIEVGTKLEQQTGNHMKTRTFRIDGLIPVLGIALVGGGYFPMKAYLGYQEEIHSGEQFRATVACLWEDCDLGRLLTQAQYSGCTMTALRVEELLSAHLVADSPRLASADPQARALAEAVAQFVDRRRSESAAMAGNVPAGGSDHGVAGQTMLTQTLASASPVK